MSYEDAHDNDEITCGRYDCINYGYAWDMFWTEDGQPRCYDHRPLAVENTQLSPRAQQIYDALMGLTV